MSPGCAAAILVGRLAGPSSMFDLLIYAPFASEELAAAALQGVSEGFLSEVSYSAGLYRRARALNPADASTGPAAWEPGKDVVGVRGLAELSSGSDGDAAAGAAAAAGGLLGGRRAKLAQMRGFRSAVVLEAVPEACDAGPVLPPAYHRTRVLGGPQL